EANVGAGIHFWGDVSQQVRFLEMGANFLIHSADILLFQKHLSADLCAIRKTAGIKVDTLDDGKVDSI
ncbi:MAG TPA: aldolase, partial [Verrucomicrobiales bacterium]|nr:aldolase [Verrucomicrobiales bacterium]